MKFKKGDRVICKSGAFYDEAVGKIGTVLGTNKCGSIGVQYDENIGGHNCGGFNIPSGKSGHCMWSNEGNLELVSRSHPTIIIITTDGTTTVATMRNGKEIVRTATAKCSPADIFDHAVGARLALDRLLWKEPEKPEVREVARNAKPGEWIKIVRPSCTYPGGYSTGDILKVTRPYEFGLGWVKCGEDIVCIGPDEYIVLEGYTPPND